MVQGKETTRGKVYTNNLLGLQPRGLFKGAEEDKVPRAKSWGPDQESNGV